MTCILSLQDYALTKAGDGMLPSDFFGRKFGLSLKLPGGRQGIRLPPPFPTPACGEGLGRGCDNTWWGSDYLHSKSTFRQSRKILGRSAAGGPRLLQTAIRDRRRQHRPRVADRPA
jgi:hypothetical protein